MNLGKQEINVKLWILPLDLELKSITEKEKKWSANFSKSRRYEFQYSRGYTRLVLSNLFNVEPLSIPLYSKPAEPPLLGEGFGFLSISHCQDALFIGWSNKKIGVDIESINRNLDANKLSNYLCNKEEKLILYSYCKESFAYNFLSLWVRKEAVIKYSKGKIMRDFKSWIINESINTATCIRTSNIASVNLIKYKTWLIGVASEKRDNKIPKIINFSN